MLWCLDKMKINNLQKHPRWKNFECICKGKELDLCFFCKYSRALASVPKENFVVKEMKVEKKGNKFVPTGKTVSRTIKEITIIQGGHGDVIAWKW